MPDAPASWTPAPATPFAPPPARNPMEGHVKAIAIIDIVFGAFAALGALVILTVFGAGAAVTGAATEVDWLPGFLAAFGAIVALFLGLLAALGIGAGVLLLKRRRAGKGLGIAAAILQLFNVPIGTALGVYALVILTRPETDQLLAG